MLYKDNNNICHIKTTTTYAIYRQQQHHMPYIDSNNICHIKTTTTYAIYRQQQQHHPEISIVGHK